MHPLRTAFATLSLTLAASCHDATAPLQGCFVVTFGDGAPPGAKVAKLLRLTNEVASSASTPFDRIARASPEGDAEDDHLLRGLWYRSADDSLHVITGGGFVGMRFHLVRDMPGAGAPFYVDQTNWHGKAEMWLDTPELNWTSGVTFNSTGCRD